MDFFLFYRFFEQYLFIMQKQIINFQEWIKIIPLMLLYQLDQHLRDIVAPTSKGNQNSNNLSNQEENRKSVT